MEIPEIDVSQLEAAMGEGGFLFDVREVDEYAAGRIPGARHISMATVPDRLAEFRVEGPAYVVCGSGGRSARVVEFLRANGVDAVNVAGGTNAWIESGREYESDHGSV